MPQKSVTPKIAVAPVKAVISDLGSSTSPWTTSTPRAARARLDALLGSRVMPRTFQPGMARKVSTTEPP